MSAIIDTYMILTAVILSSLLYQHVRAEGQFYGGSMSYKIEKQADGTNRVTIELITGWVLGKGPCGPGCNRSDIGRSTRSTRPLMTRVDQDYLGSYESDHRNRSTGRTDVQDMNALVLSTYNETVLAVKEHETWEQELLDFSFMMPNKVEQLDVNFDGKSWRKLTLQRGTSSWHFQTTVSTYLRSDTGKANQSPQAFARPFYRIKLGVGTGIQIPAVDAEGDYIKCGMANFVEGGDIAIHLPPNVRVFENCIVYINASESSGYTDDSWIAVPVSVRDYNREKIVYGTDDYMPAKFSLSTTAVQFIVQVLANLITPEFVEPTLEGNHLFIMYADTTFRTEIYAKAPENTTIESFATLGIQGENLKLSSLQQDPRRQRVQYAILSWKPSAGEIGRHIICVSASDNTGVDSSEERCFILDVKGDAFNYTTKVSPGKPYFVDIPSPDQFVDCKMLATCVVAIYVKSAVEVVDIRVTESYIDNFKLGPIRMIAHNGEQIYQTDLSFEHSLHGNKSICFIARDKNGGESEKVCIQSKIEPPDPCVSAPCMNSATCVRDGDTGGFKCHCLSGYYGKSCETKEDKCKPDPCVRDNSVVCVGMYSILCYCKAGFSGDTCAENIDDCHANACNGHGTCKDRVMDFDCECFSRYNGTHCEFDKCSTQADGILSCPGDIDDCSPHLCQNGATCGDKVGNNTCVCLPGYTGRYCEIDIDECKLNPCQNGATCVDEVNNYTCVCDAGYTGRDCENVLDPCSPNPCVRGTCFHHASLYHCVCPSGYTGKKCEISIGINGCLSQPCLNGGICVDHIGYFTCNCSSGFVGNICETDVNECISQPCLNGGFCKDGIDQFLCECPAGFDGARCQNVVDPCVRKPCVRGICFSHGAQFLCECPTGFTGELCETTMTLNGPKETYFRVPIGSELKLNCSVSGPHLVTFYWSKLNGCGLKYASYIKASIYRRPHASFGAAGTYICTASDGYGPNITRYFHVDIIPIQKEEVCDFDDGTLCSWEQQKNDSFDWTFQNGPTQSVGTGPDVDHTLGTVQGKYIYIETSSPRRFGEHASLLSHVLPASRTMCFQFWYYMFGDGSGRLFVLLQDTCLNTKTELFKETGDKGAQWNKASITITSQSVPNDYRLVLKADVGATFHGDTAVDDLVIHDGPCRGSQGAPIVG